jgi:mono/diheme cytochrome c family protein
MKIKFLGALMLLLMFGSINLFAQTKHKPVSAKARLNAAIARGSIVYTQNCLSCHQADGGGVQNMNPPLIKTTYVLGDKTKLITIVLKGFNEDVEINDQTFSNTMAPHDFMTDQQIADVLTYVRNSFTNKASRVMAAEVKKVRASVVVAKK